MWSDGLDWVDLKTGVGVVHRGLGVEQWVGHGVGYVVAAVGEWYPAGKFVNEISQIRALFLCQNVVAGSDP